MNAESSRPSSTVSTEEALAEPIPLFLSSSSSSLKPLRERNRTNLKRRTNLSRSQVLSDDFENEDSLSTTNHIRKPTVTNTNSQPPITPVIHSQSEIYSKSKSPTTPSPIHTTVTCSQVWERLASNEEHQQSASSPTNSMPTTTISDLPTHISFSYDASDSEDENEDLPQDDKDDFQYVPVSSQSKLVQFQFLTFAKQQQLDFNNDSEHNEANIQETQNIAASQYTYQEDEHDDDDDDDDDDNDENNDVQEQLENRTSKKRKRSLSATNSLSNIPSLPITNHDMNAPSSSTTTKPPCTKKPKTKDPNANFQRLNMRKKHFSHAKKHQFAKHKRNAFYRRTRHAGGHH